MFIVMAKMHDGTAHTMRSFLSEQDAKRHADEIMKACETSRQDSEALRNIGEEPKFPNMIDYGARIGSLGGYVFPNADAQVRYEEDRRNYQRIFSLWQDRRGEISNRIDRRFVDVQSVSIMKL
jgi:hypothetical protein